MRHVAFFAAAIVTTAVQAQSGAAPPRSAQTPAALRADVNQFRNDFLGVERSYSAAARAQAESRLKALEGALDTIRVARFELELAQIVALADNGHTNAAASLRAQRYNRVPVRLVPFGTDFHVVRARGANSDLLGARIVAIDAKPIADVRAVARQLTGGTASYRDRSVPFFLESPDLLNAARIATEASGASYEFELADGRRVTRKLIGEPPDANRPLLAPGRAFYPDPAVSEPDGWRGLVAPSRAPWSLQDVGTRFRWRDAPELRGFVVELRQNRPSPGADLDAFISEVQRELRARKPQNLVLDMRMNGGGDLNTTRDFMRSLPRLVSGKIFVLTSPWTFSAAISSVGYLKQAAPDRVTIVGEMVGDRLEFWAEGGPATLGNTQMVIGRATERHDYANGCRAFSDCHRSVVREPISVRTFAPDINAPWTIDAYRAGRDPGMEAVVRAAGGSSTPNHH